MDGILDIHHEKVQPAWSASGAEGFFKTDKYWYHKPLSILGLWFIGSTFVAKTTTLAKRVGNAKLEEDGISFSEKVPKCIIVKWWKRVVLNAVGLSGPGIRALFAKNKWQKRRDTFFISIMSVAGTLEERKEEIREMITIILEELKFCKGRIIIQLNVSCPNVGAEYKSIVLEATQLLDVIAEVDPLHTLGVVVKLAPTVSPVEVKDIEKHERCSGFCLGNTLPFGQLKNRIDWKKLFGTDIPKESPLYKLFEQAGALSGKPLLPIVCDLIRGCRKVGVRKHINGCGGIFGFFSALRVMLAGADSISIGCATMLSPWGIVPAIAASHMVTWWRKNIRSFRYILSGIPFRFRSEYKYA